MDFECGGSQMVETLVMRSSVEGVDRYLAPDLRRKASSAVLFRLCVSVQIVCVAWYEQIEVSLRWGLRVIMQRGSEV